MAEGKVVNSVSPLWTGTLGMRACLHLEETIAKCECKFLFFLICISDGIR